MAIDGSFILESELKRFLDRCPMLKANHQFSLLSHMGEKLTETDVVDTVGELFLHPSYTIPLIGCFRPIVQKIVDRAVHLLQLVPDLRSNSKSIAAEFKADGCIGDTRELGDDVVNVIDFYGSCGRVLSLHEHACLAFCRALDLAPFLLRYILSYFKFAPAPFERILKSGSDFEISSEASSHILNSVRTSYFLLLREPEIFLKLWDWSCFLDLLRVPASINTDSNTEFLENISDIRWCSIRIVSIALKIAERKTKKFGREAEDDLASLLRWDKFCGEVSLEKASWYIGSSQPNVSCSLYRSINFSCEPYVESFHANALVTPSSRYSEIEPSVRTKRQSTCYRGSDFAGYPFVLTSKMMKSFEMASLAVSQKWPVLLYGSAGSGKTALISKLARDSGNRVLSVHMDGQMDGKTLVGGYVSAEQPGEFRWQPGSLTLAVMNGYWAVFEDVDKAPSDVQSILLPLLEGAVSFVTGHGEAVMVAEEFRLFSTISSSKLDASYNGKGGSSVGSLWRRVMVPSPSKADLAGIVKAWYPSLEPIVGRLIETFERVNWTQQHAGFWSGKYDPSHVLGRFSSRDLLKWCKRINNLGCNIQDGDLSPYMCNCIYQEAVDVFAAYSISTDNRLTIMNDIAKMWSPLLSIPESLYSPNKPLIQNSISELIIGRISLECLPAAHQVPRKPFVSIRSSLYVLERIACSVKYNEPVLLVGETGTGKTTLVQNLASRLGQQITVMNLSQQSDIADLLGGFKPTDASSLCIPLYKEFMDLLSKSSVKFNGDFPRYLDGKLMGKNWKSLLRGFQKAVVFFQKKYAEPRGPGEKRKKRVDEKLIAAWEIFSVKLDTVHNQIGTSSGMMFSFQEGAFVTSLRNGDWVLLDEINLAPPETLQRIVGVLDEESASICLTERGDIDYIYRHPNFRIFACMNPATDAGKRDLPYSLRSRFTEYFVDDILGDEDLYLFINEFIGDFITERGLVNKMVQFYKEAKKLSEEKLQDGANQKPQYSLRSLYRALEYTKKANKKFGFEKALYDGFCMFFLNLLDLPSAKIMNNMIFHLLVGKIPQPVSFDKYLMNIADTVCGDFSYVLTESVKKHLENLAQAIFIRRYPVLLQGPTSSGKTSLVRYLAAMTDHEFVRINNHEHTDLQEYLGSYITDVSGKLVFHEGVLVKAVRNGYWVVLDELNLAPSDVLEALNRLLDDNRELFVPELSVTISAHPDFMLFATQNPPNFYGGRKMLSRAFRNRFVEIHVDEIPEAELSTILEHRCKISGSNAKRMVAVMKDLQLHRQRTKVFSGKHGFITPRDLFRWADRLNTTGNTKEDLAWDGYLLLAERLREESEKTVVIEVLEKHLRVKIGRDYIKNQVTAQVDSFFMTSGNLGVAKSLGSTICTQSMQRLYYLVDRCYRMREPVLLVGETGGGKTTVCQILSLVLGSKLHILNCHQYTETSDFLGGFYPVRDRSQLTSKFKYLVDQLLQSKAHIYYDKAVIISSDISQASSTVDTLSLMISRYRQGLLSCADVAEADLKALEQMKLDLTELSKKWQTIFMWHDGPLVQAMRCGDLFLVDEISLADDSVLERLNSVLESERKLTLAEKGGPRPEAVVAHPDFFLLATMNPSGDYGKKELSPALRNRFTEIWVPPVTDLEELRTIALERFSSPKLYCVLDPMLKFWEWFNQSQSGRMLTVRDLLSWVDFINLTERNLEPKCALLHGAFLVLLDGLTFGTSISEKGAAELRERCFSFLLEQLKVSDDSNFVDGEVSTMGSYGWGDGGMVGNISHGGNLDQDIFFGIYPFYIEKGNENCEDEEYKFFSPTTHRNALRLLRAMQLSKPVLLEGSPGVGKTSLVVALGKLSRHRVVRINLSEQSDMMDLLGSDLPVESDEGLKFAWCDGILLQALKKGCWVLLDEVNLAPQSVLEGLNAILDHRSEVFVPELNQTFKCPSSFRIFACQNPAYQGGGRKGLPRSFLNRFTKVYVDKLVEDDYLFICSSLYPSIPKPLLSKLIDFNKLLHEDTMVCHKFGRDGSPWEFNLRDVIRSCQLIQDAPPKLKESCFLNMIYVQRMRTVADRKEVLKLFEHVFGVKPCLNPYPRVHLNPHYLFVGSAAVKRATQQSHKALNNQLKILPSICHSLEAAAQCVQFQWLCILMGPSASGKTSLIRMLAHLTGNVLNEISLSSATDTSEIIGCFEQYNVFRNFHAIVAEVERYVTEICSLHLESSVEAFVNEKKYLISKWLTFLSSFDSIKFLSTAYTFLEHQKAASDSLILLGDIIKLLLLDVEKNSLPVSWSCSDLCRVLKKVIKLQENCCRRPSVKFEWVGGLLLKAIENGEWIVLENANVCNPTVLDRINSLVEPCGSIVVNECGIVDGDPVVLHPHPKFRMFLTLNPAHGEVSRAMRNRGVEIFLMPPFWLLEKGNVDCNEEAEFDDVKRFLILSGIPIGRFVDSMAKAHIYARNAGKGLNVGITYLELSRWVQLFQQLFVHGNQPLWSLWTSWEHTYISSLGEAEGCKIIATVIDSFLSSDHLYKLDWSFECSLRLPGGSPMPAMLRDFICYSKEASVKQNCMYLKWLGAQCASYELNAAYGKWPAGQALGKNAYKCTSFMNLSMMFPNASEALTLYYSEENEFNLAVANRKLLFAASWVLEQAIETDLKLYVLWFSWMNSQLQPFCQFFRCFVDLLEQEFKHSIWSCIFQCRRELLSHYQVDLDWHPIPVLSFELFNITASDDFTELPRKLSNAIKCVGLLRLTFRQWDAESNGYNNVTQCFAPILGSLHLLEEKVLDMLVESSSFDVLFKLYDDLLSDHIFFWNSIASSQHIEYLPLCWRSLIKNATKLLHFGVSSAESFLSECKSFEGGSSWRLNTHKPILWLHGGHPFVPSSSVLFDKQQKILSFCEFIWSTCTNSWEHVNKSFIEVIVSSSLDIRLIAVQGACISLHLDEQFQENDAHHIQQLEDIFQMLTGKYEHEKQKMLPYLLSEEDTSPWTDSAVCCVFSPELLCRKSVFLSWQEMLPIVDSTSFFMDMDLLKELAAALANAEDLQLALSSIAELLEFAFNFSLKDSSRSPTDFLPHQKILWTLDAWSSVDAVGTKISSFVLEMWFKCHSSLWTHFPVSVKECFMVDSCDISLPRVLFQPMKLAAVLQILQSEAFTVKDYSVHCLKLRAFSLSLWNTPFPGTFMPALLLSSARSLFQQIIFAHKKTFDADKYFEIKSILSSSKNEMITQEKIDILCSLIASSKHRKLASSVNQFIGPVLKQLYHQCSSADTLYDLGQAWLRIGGLRWHLLLCFDGLDPAMKNSFKYSQLQEKKILLELEIKVRQECDDSVGWSSTRESNEQRAVSLKNLEIELKRLKQKIVFRPDPSKLKKLQNECDVFATSFIEILKTAVSRDSRLMMADKICNWQETAASFIGRLSAEYNSYADIIQPVQVAVYEMKLGLSVILSSVFQKDFLHRVDHDSMNQVSDVVYSFMRFPRDCMAKTIFIEVNGKVTQFPFCSIKFTLNVCEADMSLLEKLATATNDVLADKASVLQQKAYINQNILVRVAHFVANTRLLNRPSFMLMDKIFNAFTNLWMSMKVQSRNVEDFEAQQYKFKPRVIKIDNIFEDDGSVSNCSLPNQSLSEWQEVFSMRNFFEMEEDCAEKIMEEEWNLVLDSICKSMVHIHNQLFGSVYLSTRPGTIHDSDTASLLSFIDSYSLGSGMIKGLGGLSSSLLDAKLVPEHLLRLCLEHERIANSLRFSARPYNFYKDSNAPVMFKMVKLVTALREQIIFLLRSWEDHPGLKNLFNLTEMLLSLPLATPLAKALSGLQFLYNRASALLESASEFSLSEQLKPILVMISSWLKMELGSWPALLDEIHVQYDTNAAKLWFPLCSVLQHRYCDDVAEYLQSTIQSLVEFIQTSSIGEFKKRLELLCAFHGQIKSGLCVGFYSSPCQMGNLKVLYNVFGFYVQFLPRILDYLSAGRRNIEIELKELLKLCRWEHFENSSSIENIKKIRQKLRKLVQKYNDLLEQPVIFILNHSTVGRGVETPCMWRMELLGDFSCKNEEMLNVAYDLIWFREERRSIWYVEWKKKVDIALQKLQHGSPDPEDMHAKNHQGCIHDAGIAIQDFVSNDACNVFQREWNVVWCMLEKLCGTVMDCCESWVDGKKDRGKRRALSELLKLLELCGLSKHTSIFFEDQLGSIQLNGWFVQPAYDAEHLLLTQETLPSSDVDMTTSGHCCGTLDAEWKIANQCYFKSVASVQLLQHICLNFHKDFTLDQVSRSLSFLKHLIEVQQEQRAAIYKLSGGLQQLKKCLSSLEILWCATAPNEETFSKSFITPNQHATFKCMWQQKQLVDYWCAILHEESLLLKAFDSTHLDTCAAVKTSAKRVLDFVEKFEPVFKKSKGLLDSYLLGCDKIMIAGDKDFLPCLISNRMENMLLQNFQAMKEFEEALSAFRNQDVNKMSVPEVFLARFDPLIGQGKVMAGELNLVLKTDETTIDPHKEAKLCDENDSEVEASFYGALQKTWELTMDVFQKLGSSTLFSAVSENSLQKLTSWKPIFEFFSASLQLESICNELLRTIFYARELVNHSKSKKDGLLVQVEGHLKHLDVFLDLLVGYSQGLLCDSLAMHRTVSILTNALANVFSSLYSKGFGTSVDEQMNDFSLDKCQDAKGTGMGEGAGLNDVSDQINDEDQLLGPPLKPIDEKDESAKVPGNDDKGIEMDQDFAADTFSVSEDSGNDSDDAQDEEQLESAMGNTGDKGEVADEQFWDKDEDEKLGDGNEKYESGPSVSNKDSSCRELRAKEDPGADADDGDGDGDDGSGDFKPKDSERHDDEEVEGDGLDNADNEEDNILQDKEDAYMDPTGLKPDALNHDFEEDIDMDVPENGDPLEGVDLENKDESIENENVEGEISPMDAAVEDAQAENADVENEMDSKQNHEDNANESLASSKNAQEVGNSGLVNDYLSNPRTTTELNGDSLPMDDLRNDAAEKNWSINSNANTDFSPIRGLPGAGISETDIMLGDSRSGTFTNELSEPQFPPNYSSPVKKTQANPFRNVGDALSDWKERVHMSMDFQENDEGAVEDMINENADEYGYTHEDDNGMAQALGPATAEQAGRNINDSEPVEDAHAAHDEQNLDKGDSESNPFQRCSMSKRDKVEEWTLGSEAEKSAGGGSPEVRSHGDDAAAAADDFRSLSGSLVTVKKCYMDEEMTELSELRSVSNGERDAENLDEPSIDLISNASMKWRKYESLTTRLSQELAEQLRLVMEPTLASKLQGDYRTGKRINMRKVIPYIASHYQKDKIWLRRTRPNKRDYQVVIAVDDSQSMSESNCGDVAVEALVAVCRAMSQLEVGNLAVASFGRKGNIKLLHEFDHPFTMEAGVKVISDLTFKQENTIVDEPMVDLLNYLNSMLDAAVAKAQLPSGINPLEQLVLIIADGRLHEKERLRRCVRDVLNRRRMVAFLLLDNPHESIMDLQEISFAGKELVTSRYLDSFPFPYYIVLRNIEELPRTLADLLKQWFELTQYTRD